MKGSKLVQKRPTESINAVAGSLAFLVVYLLGVEEPAVYFALGVVFAWVPSAITWGVELYRGKEKK